MNEKIALDVSEAGHCDDRILLRDQILVRKIGIIKTDPGPPLITVFIGYLKYFRLDHAEKQFFICKYGFLFFCSFD